MKKSIVIVTWAGILLFARVASAEIVVITNIENPATRMFTEQAAQFFLGKSNMFTPIDLPADSHIRAEFYQKVANKSPAQVSAIWSKLEFSAKAQPPREMRSDAEVKKAVASDPKAIAYIDKTAVDNTVKVLLTLP